ncbi:TetR/AcrR family transcriptional regulator [Microbacterium sp. NPDC077663]|uniref:TetR/AcrR family transcriptional regulator n=1 Tax=Microbacterium sp. NPDC077663 TaxID=3364189 RepID=UPI0037C6615A
MTSSETVTVRKDAERNRQRLLAAARVIFAARGLDASMSDIAREAGLGTGTAYRHFRSKQDLLEATFREATRSFFTQLELTLQIQDPWSALVGFMEMTGEIQSRDRSLHQIFKGDSGVAQYFEWNRLATVLTELLSRATKAGRVRPDVHPSDVIALFATLGTTYELSASVGSEIWRRHVDLFLRGIQPDSPTSGFPAPEGVPTKTLTASLARQDRPRLGPPRSL